jgi:hypothetical protein
MEVAQTKLGTARYVYNSKIVIYSWKKMKGLISALQVSCNQALLVFKLQYALENWRAECPT